ncbi:hypothetical protein [Nocardia grenadensis]|uniref:hypothetical protein n=1 Tax=Nocardia grenadensis TaxID=931537 RepID=UPI000A07AF8E|nr:hypothetical protein [Nocardia grenadensis]
METVRVAGGPGVDRRAREHPELTHRPENRHIPEQVRVAVGQLPGSDDVIAAAIADARGRQRWAVVGRHLRELGPVRIHLPATTPDRWHVTAGLDVSLWTAALALDDANHPHLLRLRAASEP